MDRALITNGYPGDDITQHERYVKHQKRNTILLSIAILLLTVTLIFAIRANMNISKIEPGHRYPNPDISNLWEIQDKLHQYYEKDEYIKDLSKIEHDVTNWITNDLPAIKNKSTKPLLAVFDIDETLLNNYEYYSSTSFAWISDSWTEWVDSGKAPQISEVFNILKNLKKYGVDIALITGRNEPERAATINNLTLQGISPEYYTTLILRSADEGKISAATYKATHRQILSDKYDIVACVGDQYSDCQGGYTGLSVKLPNYIYFIV